MSEENQNQGQFALQRIYIKDLSFEAPNTPAVFLAPWNPEVNVQLSTRANPLGDNKNIEVILDLTVTVKNDNTTAFLIELQQAGIFLIEGVPPQQVEQLVGAFCPNILFPYAREAVSDIANRGSFPQLLLAPINFDAAYADAVRRRQEEVAAAPETVQ